MSETKKEIDAIMGTEVVLENGSQVWLGRYDDERVAIMLTNKDKVRTHALLSHQAIEALWALYCTRHELPIGANWRYVKENTLERAGWDDWWDDSVPANRQGPFALCPHGKTHATCEKCQSQEKPS